MKSGNLNFLEPYGPLQACNGTAVHFNYYLSPPFKVLKVIHLKQTVFPGYRPVMLQLFSGYTLWYM